MNKVWVACIDGRSDMALFSTAEKAYGQLIYIFSDNGTTEDADRKAYWEMMAEDLNSDYDHYKEEFGCDYCWARAEEVS